MMLREKLTKEAAGRQCVPQGQEAARELREDVGVVRCAGPPGPAGKPYHNACNPLFKTPDALTPANTPSISDQNPGFRRKAITPTISSKTKRTTDPAVKRRIGGPYRAPVSRPSKVALMAS